MWCGSASSFIVEYQNTSVVYIQVCDIIMGERGCVQLVAIQSSLDIGWLLIAQTSLLLTKQKKFYNLL